jgi:hypothetical protein
MRNPSRSYGVTFFAPEGVAALGRSLRSGDASPQQASFRNPYRTEVALVRDEIGTYAMHALAANGFGDAAIGPSEQHNRKDTVELDRCARADRSRRFAQMLEATLRVVGELVRRMVDRSKRRRLAKATYRALSGLDANALRDLGFHHTEIQSVAAEIAGDAPPTRVRCKPRGLSSNAISTCR